MLTTSLPANMDAVSLWSNASSDSDLSRYVHLNVGGVSYTTTRETLTRYQDSMLGYIFSQKSVPLEKDEHGRFIIDRDGQLFRYILNFLRDGVLNLSIEFGEGAQLLAEARYYKLDNMINKFPVHLNVGGVIYNTTRGTITRQKGSLLKTWFSQSTVPLRRDREGRYSINRDGELFQFVLNFLEDEQVYLPRGFTRLRELIREARYYKLDAMESVLNVGLGHHAFTGGRTSRED